MKKRILFLLVSLSVFLGMSLAQVGQTGAIKGSVTTEDGTPMPGVTVTIKSPALIGQVVTVTNERGVYRALNLPPGNYEITFELEGFTTVIRKGIVVNANFTITVDVVMEPAKIEETITVTGKSPTVDRQSTAKVITMDREFLQSVPAGRDLNYLLNMAPSTTGNSTLGATVRDNLYAMDGVEINDPSVGTIAGNPISMEIAEEISVQIGGVSAEWGSVKGGIVNIVTKSGGNRVSGDIHVLYEHEDLKSDNTKGTPFEGQTTGNKFWIEPSFSIGGPVIKDKLWFFLNFTYRGWEYFEPGFPYDGPEIPLKDGSYNPYFKLTFQPSQADRLFLSMSYKKRDEKPGWGSKWDNIDTVQNVFRRIIIPSFHWIHTWGPNFITHFKAGALFYKWDFVPTANGAKPLYWEYTTGLSSNGSGFEDLYQRTRVQVNFDGTLYVDNLAGSHEIKFGIQNSFHYTRRRTNVFGPKDSGGLTRLYVYTYYGTPYMAEWALGFNQICHSLNSGLFFNDAWQVSKRLTLNLGLRFDYNWNYTPKQNGAVGGPAEGSLAHLGYPDLTWDLDIEETTTHFKWKTFSPRLGVIFDLTGDGKTLLKANFSQYLQENYTAITWFVSPVGWVWVTGYTDSEGNFTWPWGIWLPGSYYTVGYPGHPLVAPRTYEAIVGLERELFEDVSVGVRFIRRWDRKLIEDVNAAALDMEALMERGELIWNSDMWQPVTVIDPYSGEPITFYDQVYWDSDLYMVNPPGLKRDYKGIEFTIRKRFSRGWSLDFSYTYQQSTGLVQNTYWASELDEPLYNDPNAHINAYGSMGLERPHMFKLAGVVKGPFGINISGYIRYLKGRARPRYVNSANLGLWFDKTIIAEKFGSYYLPYLFIVDLRLEKEFKIGDALVLRVFGDAFNLTNANTTTAWNNDSSSLYLEFHETTAILGPRVFRLGARIEFNL